MQALLHGKNASQIWGMNYYIKIQGSASTAVQDFGETFDVVMYNGLVIALC